MRRSTRDQRLRTKFNFTEAEFDNAFKAQGSGCIICGSTPKTRSLHLDHDHHVSGWKIKTKKLESGSWMAFIDGGPMIVGPCYSGTRVEAVEAMKLKLKRASLRGIICFHCNNGLKRFKDNPVLLKKAAEYLDNYYDYLNGSSDNKHPHLRGLNAKDL